MKTIVLFGLMLFVLSIPAFAQDDSSVAAVSWERYSLPNQKISVMLPKMPTRDGSSDQCRVRNTYYAYAEQVVYEFTLVYREGANVRCAVPFGDALAALGNPGVNEPTEWVAGIPSYKFESGTSTRWIIPDLNKSRWVELAVHHRPDVKPNVEQFIGSLSLDTKDGKDIGNGADATVGDINVKTDVFWDLTSTDPTTVQIYFLSKPHARYTEEARKNMVKGTVSLRVPLLANGAVGKIEVVTGLKHGLTEQAIAAAKKITFIPKMVKRQPGERSRDL